MKDYDIVVAMRRGESASFEQFVERFHHILLDYARRAHRQPFLLSPALRTFGRSAA